MLNRRTEPLLVITFKYCRSAGYEHENAKTCVYFQYINKYSKNIFRPAFLQYSVVGSAGKEN